jgi:hypothetical protein
MWRDAAREAGVPLEAVHDSDVLRPWSSLSARDMVYVLPDGTHQDSSPILLEKLRARLDEGASVLLTADAFARDYPEGVLHALCERHPTDFRYGATTFGSRTSPLLVTARGAERLGYPPGTLVRDPAGGSGSDARYAWTGYQAPRIPVAHSPTHGSFPGEVLAAGADGDVLEGLATCGAGSVLFANLPLSYLKNRTDGLQMQLALEALSGRGPRLLSVPDGIGGLVFNFHVDSNAATLPLKRLEAQGVFKSGPFSIHVTAGPDARKPGDGMGFAADTNAQNRALLRRLADQGHAIGSHGGWIHDYFGKHLTSTPQEPYLSYLAENKRALEDATGRPVTEYSAPIGNHPAWVTGWLTDHAIQAYYTTGDVGQGPTRAYLDGKRLDATTWSFPISVHGTRASLEELLEDKTPPAEIERWLDGLTDFAADHRQIRLVYSHPPGIEGYARSVLKWLKHSDGRTAQGTFRFYRMTDVASFLSRRDRTQWAERLGGDGLSRFEARNPETLESQSWCLPVSRYDAPQIESGSATAERASDCWLIRAGKGRELKFAARAKDARKPVAN